MRPHRGIRDVPTVPCYQILDTIRNGDGDVTSIFGGLLWNSSGVDQLLSKFRGTVAATTEDQLYRLTLNVLGDSSVLLDSLDIIVRVPGTAF
jgi:DNA-binding IclR family transcriptional regulator